MIDEDFDTITEKFTSNRDQLPAMFIATSYDQETSVWTKNNPTTQVYLHFFKDPNCFRVLNPIFQILPYFRYVVNYFFDYR